MTTDAVPMLRANFGQSLQLLERHGFAAQTVIDVGAAEGAFFLGRERAGLYPKARHFFIDAMRENEDTYCRLAARFGAGYEIAALSCVEGEAILRIDPDFYNTHIDRLQPDTAYAATRRVPMRTLDAVVGQHRLEPPFMVKLDVQGAELDVLRGARRTLEEATVVTTEIQVFSERDTLVELLAFMQGAGWALFDLTDLAYYRTHEALYQCYATFIPRSMDFRRASPFCTPEQEARLLEGLRARRAGVQQAIELLLGG